jgi:hypothetical protein
MASCSGHHSNPQGKLQTQKHVIFASARNDYGSITEHCYSPNQMWKEEVLMKFTSMWPRVPLKRW